MTRPIRGRHGHVLLITLALALPACGEDTTGPGADTTPVALAFTTEPSDVEVNLDMTAGVQVEVRNAAGSRVTDATTAITLTIDANPSGATLGGTFTANAVNGVANFSDLALDRVGDGYTLTASATDLDPDTSAPFDVTFPIAMIAPGALHMCALTEGGHTYCWGDGAGGKMGNGSNADRAYPTPIAEGFDFVSLTAGSDHTCGLTSEGTAYCWGQNGFGRLGDGTTNGRSTPTEVSGGHTFAMLTAGQVHTCGVTTSDEAYCWGYGASGRLGTGNETDQSTPTAVTGGLSFDFIEAGISYTCGIDTTGATYCWGFNGYGTLGDGTNTQRSSPTAVDAPGVTFEVLGAGVGSHICGITDGKDLYCWGFNNLGQLGLGDTTDRDVPTLVGLGADAEDVVAGGNETCALVTGGEVLCWGNNSFGQVGDGTNTTRNAPVSVTGGMTFASVHQKGNSPCAVTADGDAYCWGRNDQGQLGDGTKNSSSTPVRVGNP